MKTTQQIRITEQISLASNSLNIINRLIGELNSNNLCYCHWKSNFSLTAALMGETDLDLLVERKSLSQVLTILLNLGFKTAVTRWEQGTPGVSHFYGYDSQIGQLVHIHLFSHVITGESFVKSHLLPFEPMLLENADSIEGVRVTAKPAELVLFVLRTYIKYGSLLDLMQLRRGSGDIRAEVRCYRLMVTYLKL